MKRKALLYALFGSALVVMSLTYPRERTLVRTVEIEAPPDEVYATVKDLLSWSSWSPWRDVDPSLRFAEAGVGPEGGLQCQWRGDMVGEGCLRVEAQRPGFWLETALYRSGEVLARERWVLRRLDGGRTRVSWTLSRRSPWPRPLRSLAAVLGPSGSGLGHGLSLLKAEVETRPRE